MPTCPHRYLPLHKSRIKNAISQTHFNKARFAPAAVYNPEGVLLTTSSDYTERAV